MSASLATQQIPRPERRRQQREEQKKQKRTERGTSLPSHATRPNRKSVWTTPEEQTAAEQETAQEQLQVYRNLMPILLKRLARIPDPRNPQKVKHELTVLMLYGILMFVFQMASRRQTNERMSNPLFLLSLSEAFPELATMPHQDTLFRLLARIEVRKIEELHQELLRVLIRRKKFQHLLAKNNYLVAVDGTQKYTFVECPDSRCLRRRLSNGEMQYYVYVLEACLVFSNGMVLPLMSEFLENDPELEQEMSEEKRKQDCERKAFYRLAGRLKKAFPKLSIELLLDGLYATGPVFALCRANRWSYRIVFKDKALKSVYEEIQGLKIAEEQVKAREAKKKPEDRKPLENERKQKWKGRQQHFQWYNNIVYVDSNRISSLLHVAECHETWEEQKDGKTVVHSKRHVWISSELFTAKNVHDQCNQQARRRWAQENNILKEKRQGYQYEHVFTQHWNAMQGYHHLMHIGRLLNELAVFAVAMEELLKTVGTRQLIEEFRITMQKNTWDGERIREVIKHPRQLRLRLEAS